MRFLTRSALIVALAFVCGACEEPKRAEQVSAPKTAEEKAQPVKPTPSSAKPTEAKPLAEKAAPAEVKEDGRPTGIVAEQKYTGDYVYVRIQKADKTDVWVAAAVFRGTIGDKVYLPNDKELKMKNFVSKVLNRTFEEIYFVREVERPGGARAPSSRPSSAPASRPSSAAAAAPAKKVDVEALKKKAEEEGLPGKVLKAESVGEYTYLHINTGFKEAWVAATKMEVKPGDMVLVKGGVLMKNFQSKSLDRTFEEIYFANEVNIVKKP